MFLVIITICLLLPGSAEAATLARPTPTKGYVLMHKKPRASSPGKKLRITTERGRTRRLLVLRQREGWLGLRTPWRPSRKTFWAREGRFRLQKIHKKITINLSRRKLSFWRARSLGIKKFLARGAATNSPSVSDRDRIRVLPRPEPHPPTG